MLPYGEKVRTSSQDRARSGVAAGPTTQSALTAAVVGRERMAALATRHPEETTSPPGPRCNAAKALEDAPKPGACRAAGLPCRPAGVRAQHVEKPREEWLVSHRDRMRDALAYCGRPSCARRCRRAVTSSALPARSAQASAPSTSDRPWPARMLAPGVRRRASTLRIALARAWAAVNVGKRAACTACGTKPSRLRRHRATSPRHVPQQAIGTTESIRRARSSPSAPGTHRVGPGLTPPARLTLARCSRSPSARGDRGGQ